MQGSLGESGTSAGPAADQPERAEAAPQSRELSHGVGQLARRLAARCRRLRPSTRGDFRVPSGHPLRSGLVSRISIRSSKSPGTIPVLPPRRSHQNPSTLWLRLGRGLPGSRVRGGQVDAPGLAAARSHYRTRGPAGHHRRRRIRVLSRTEPECSQRGYHLESGQRSSSLENRCGGPRRSRPPGHRPAHPLSLDRYCLALARGQLNRRKGLSPKNAGCEQRPDVGSVLAP